MTHDPDLQIDRTVVEMLERRAARGSSDGLQALIHTEIRSRPQHPTWLARVRGSVDANRTGRVLVLALVSTAVIGGMLAFAAGSSRPDSHDAQSVVSPSGAPSASFDSTSAPEPTSLTSGRPETRGPLVASSAPSQPRLSGPSRAVDFESPFSFVVPGDVDDAWLIQDYGRIFAMAVGHDDTREADTTDWGPEGLAVLDLREAVVHTCNADDTSSGRVPIRTDPDGIVKDLRQFSGITLTRVGTTRIDRHDAVVFDLEPGPCSFNDIHAYPGGLGGFVPTVRPGRLILTTTNKPPIGILIWADTVERLDAWLDPAQRIVGSIQFDD